MQSTKGMRREKKGIRATRIDEFFFYINPIVNFFHHFMTFEYDE